MTLKSDLESYVSTTFGTGWTRRVGQKVPDTEDLPLGNAAVTLEGTVLYADLADSTDLVKRKHDWFAADVFKNYLYCAARIIRDAGGVVTAYDGDRVMGVFIGTNRDDAAVGAGLKINHAVTNIIRPEHKRRWPQDPYVIKQKVGIDRSPLFVARTGIRGSNDLVWIGNAANNAAKMAALGTAYSTYISAAVFNELTDGQRYASNPRRGMWTTVTEHGLGYQVYGSTYWRSF